MVKKIKELIETGYEWIDYRTGAKELIKDQLTEYRIPPKLTKWYSLGGLCLFALGLQILTGTLLLLYYVPSVDEAYASVERIMLEIPYGWLVRTGHAAGSHMMIIVVLVHMISIVFMGSYKKPRELTWLTGCALLFLTLGISFTGYLLPWNQLSYWATTVSAKIPEIIPVVGDFTAKLIRGGETVNPDTLNRFYALHIVVIPAAILAFVGIHLFLIRALGISDPMERTPDSGGEGRV